MHKWKPTGTPPKEDGKQPKQPDMRDSQDSTHDGSGSTSTPNDGQNAASNVDELLSCIMDSKTSKANLKVITLNVRGLRDSKKLQSLIYWVKKKQIDIALLQGTYLNDKFKK